MKSKFTQLLTSVLVAMSYTTLTMAISSSMYATHNEVDLGGGRQIVTYHPPSTYETFGEGKDHPLSGQPGATMEDVATAFVTSELGLQQHKISFVSERAGKSAHHVYFSQTHDGIPFANTAANVAFNNDNKVVAFGSSFVEPKSIADSKPSVPLDHAIDIAEKALEGKHNKYPPSMQYFAKEDGSVVLTHVIEVSNDTNNTYKEAFVDAHTGELVSVSDFVYQASYRVVPFSSPDPTAGFSLIANPQDLAASPFGWHATALNGVPFNGNNVLAAKGGVYTAQSAAQLVFNYVQNPNLAPTAQVNVDAARVNAFYVTNMMHDVAYRYGFTEPRFNFQQNNNGKGGVAADPVNILVQDATIAGSIGTFSITPDGRAPSMKLELYTARGSRVTRDAALDNTIIAHEFTHGITTRMIGGGRGTCLTTLEARGMGEGWSDAMAEWTQTSNAVRDFRIGTYAYNNAGGLRHYPFSTNLVTNPYKYANFTQMNESHNFGEVWATILHNVYAALVTRLGWSATARTNTAGTQGNIVYLHLFMNSLPLMPCNPTVKQARDAWIQAETNTYRGAYRCTLWRAFASRGLGVNANIVRGVYTNDATVPAGC